MDGPSIALEEDCLTPSMTRESFRPEPTSDTSSLMLVRPSRVIFLTVVLRPSRTDVVDSVETVRPLTVSTVRLEDVIPSPSSLSKPPKPPKGVLPNGLPNDVVIGDRAPKTLSKAEPRDVRPCPEGPAGNGEKTSSLESK